LQQEVETQEFMQAAPFLGLVPGHDGQVQRIPSSEGKSPFVKLFKQATNAVLTHPGCLDPCSFVTLCKQAEAAGTKFSFTRGNFLLIN
jgi:cytoplasmic FMR1 interacting protein